MNEAGSPSGAEAFAVGFATEYLTVGAGSPNRERRLSPYVSPDLAANLAASTPPSGGERVVFATLAGVTPTSGGYTVTVAVRVTPRSGPGGGWMWLAVPVAARGEAFAVTEAPAVVAGPVRLAVPAPPVGGDPELADLVQPLAQRFMSAWLGGDRGDLSYLSVPGARLVPPPPFARAVTVTGVVASRRGGDVDAIVRLLAKDPGGISWPLAYRLLIVDEAGRLEVSRVSPVSPSTP